MTRYRTIVADPPWHYDGMPSTAATGFDKRLVPGAPVTKPMAYPTMSVTQIMALPVDEMAERDARLFLWATNRYLPDAFGVLAAWGFEYRQLLVWHKMKAPPFGGSVARNCAEYLLVAARGAPGRLSVSLSNVIVASASKYHHSRKPDAFMDLIEATSPGPYLELFARRTRLGWDVWGDEVDSHVDVLPGHKSGQEHRASGARPAQAPEATP